MKICQFTSDTLDLLREKCNFTDVESRCFELKAKDRTDVQLAMELNVSESTIAMTMRKVRNKIDIVLRKSVQKMDTPTHGECDRGCPNIVYHTMAEWARIPDFLSTKGVMYIYADFRNDNNDVGIPRIKFGDGINSISNLPFATMSITDKDMEYWDGHSEHDGNNFGEEVHINKTLVKYTFPSDGYLMIDFEGKEFEYAVAKIYGASGKYSFEFSKYTDTDHQSKEVFVRKGMKCEFVESSEHAIIKFVPLE